MTVPIEGVRVTPFVCYDLRFPEPFRLRRRDTDLFAVVANWPEARREHWRTLLRARAIENQCYVAGVNRVGEGGGLHYAGDSAVVSPWGEVLVEGGPEEAVLFADVDPAVVRDARAKFPALARPPPRGVPPVAVSDSIASVAGAGGRATLSPDKRWAGSCGPRSPWPPWVWREGSRRRVPSAHLRSGTSTWP